MSAMADFQTQASQQPFLLEARGLVKAFGGLKALDGVDLAIRKGETISIIGPNGSGKSTFFNLLTGIYPCDAGQILVEGRDITRFKTHQIAAAGVARTFQNIRLFSNLTVLENVLIGMHQTLRTPVWKALLRPPSLKRQEEEARARALDLLAIFGQRLTPRIDYPAFGLSYANRRRVEIVRAMAAKPKIILLDEPTAGMNPAETAELVTHVAEIKRRGFTVLVIEHKLDVVNRISDRVIVLDHGKKIAEGDASEVRNNKDVIEAYIGHKAATA
jgi:ABC-type branched-subunit amino acid transport system ATPase component